jgi:hypothetical protein
MHSSSRSRLLRAPAHPTAARRGNLGWYAVGIGLSFRDGILYVVARDFLGIAVHAIGIYGLVSGWRGAIPEPAGGTRRPRRVATSER